MESGIPFPLQQLQLQTRPRVPDHFRSCSSLSSSAELNQTHGAYSKTPKQDFTQECGSRQYLHETYGATTQMTRAGGLDNPPTAAHQQTETGAMSSSVTALPIVSAFTNSFDMEFAAALGAESAASDVSVADPDIVAAGSSLPLTPVGSGNQCSVPTSTLSFASPTSYCNYGEWKPVEQEPVAALTNSAILGGPTTTLAPSSLDKLSESSLLCSEDDDKSSMSFEQQLSRCSSALPSEPLCVNTLNASKRKPHLQTTQSHGAGAVSETGAVPCLTSNFKYVPRCNAETTTVTGESVSTTDTSGSYTQSATGEETELDRLTTPRTLQHLSYCPPRTTVASPSQSVAGWTSPNLVLPNRCDTMDSTQFDSAALDQSLYSSFKHAYTSVPCHGRSYNTFSKKRSSSGEQFVCDQGKLDGMLLILDADKGPETVMNSGTAAENGAPGYSATSDSNTEFSSVTSAKLVPGNNNNIPCARSDARTLMTPALSETSHPQYQKSSVNAAPLSYNGSIAPQSQGSSCDNVGFRRDQKGLKKGKWNVLKRSDPGAPVVHGEATRMASTVPAFVSSPSSSSLSSSSSPLATPRFFLQMCSRKKRVRTKHRWALSPSASGTRAKLSMRKSSACWPWLHRIHGSLPWYPDTVEARKYGAVASVRAWDVPYRSFLQEALLRWGSHGTRWLLCVRLGLVAVLVISLFFFNIVFQVEPYTVDEKTIIWDLFQEWFANLSKEVFYNNTLHFWIIFPASLLMDLVFLAVWFQWIALGDSLRFPVAFSGFYGIRALVRFLSILPYPYEHQNYGWRPPQLGSFRPLSLTVPYQGSDDFFFSGHAGCATLALSEFLYYRCWSGVAFATLVLVSESLALLVTRAHYTIDLFTGIIVASWIHMLAARFCPYLDRWCGLPPRPLGTQMREKEVEQTVVKNRHVLPNMGDVIVIPDRDATDIESHSCSPTNPDTLAEDHRTIAHRATSVSVPLHTRSFGFSYKGHSLCEKNMSGAEWQQQTPLTSRSSNSISQALNIQSRMPVVASPPLMAASHTQLLINGVVTSSTSSYPAGQQRMKAPAGLPV